MSTTAFGVLFYAGTILVSVWRPESPFQTPGSELVALQTFIPVRSTSTPNMSRKSSAIRWILETSANPEVVEAAAAMAPLAQWASKLDASTIYARLRDKLLGCREGEKLFLKYGKVMVHLYMQPVKIESKLLRNRLCIPEILGARRHFICDAFFKYINFLAGPGRES
jgi:hypothetical protein